MKKKLSLKNLEVKSFVTSLNRADTGAVKGMGTDIIQCGSQVDACVTAQICYPTRNITCVTDPFLTAVDVTGTKHC